MKKEKKERTFDFLTMWKDFWNADIVEKSQEEELMDVDGLTELERNELIKSLKDSENWGSKLMLEEFFKKTNKTIKLVYSKEENEQSAKRAIQRLKSDRNIKNDKERE